METETRVLGVTGGTGTARQSPWMRRVRRAAGPVVALILGVAAWEGLVRVTNWPAFILPGPGGVAARWWMVAGDGTLWTHTVATLTVVALGLALGLGIAAVGGYLIAKSPALERSLTPYLVASQAIPVVALAPLLVLWFGPGLLSKTLVCALIVFFPALINTVTGLRRIPSELHELLRVHRASRWQTLTKLELPGALPVLLSGLKIGVTLAVVGSVVAEYVGSDRGLGFLINFARGTYDTALVMAGVITLVALALTLFGLVVLLERRLVVNGRR